MRAGDLPCGNPTIFSDNFMMAGRARRKKRNPKVSMLWGARYAHDARRHGLGRWMGEEELAEGGITSLGIMLEDLEGALLK